MNILILTIQEFDKTLVHLYTLYKYGKETMENNKVKRMSFDVDEHMHSEVKAIAALKYITIQKYAIRAINKQLNEDKKYLSKDKK